MAPRRRLAIEGIRPVLAFDTSWTTLPAVLCTEWGPVAALVAPFTSQKADRFDILREWLFEAVDPWVQQILPRLTRRIYPLQVVVERHHAGRQQGHAKTVGWSGGCCAGAIMLWAATHPDWLCSWERTSGAWREQLSHPDGPQGSAWTPLLVNKPRNAPDPRMVTAAYKASSMDFLTRHGFGPLLRQFPEGSWEDAYAPRGDVADGGCLGVASACCPIARHTAAVNPHGEAPPIPKGSRPRRGRGRSLRVRSAAELAALVEQAQGGRSTSTPIPKRWWAPKGPRRRHHLLPPDFHQPPLERRA